MVRFLNPVVAVAAVLVVMTGCSAPAPVVPSPSAPSASATPTPTPEPGPPAAIVIGASELTVVDDSGLVIGTAEYVEDGAGDVVALISSVLGEVSPYVDEQCGTGDTEYLWPDSDSESLRVTVAAGPSVLPFAGMLVNSKTANVAGIEIVSSSDIGVGDDVTDLAASLPADQNRLVDWGAIVWEKTATYASPSEGDVPFGGVIFAQDGIASAILAPGIIASGFSC